VAGKIAAFLPSKLPIEYSRQNMTHRAAAGNTRKKVLTLQGVSLFIYLIHYKLILQS